MKIFPVILLFLTFAVTLSWTFDKVHENECQNRCPCLPKCCKEGQVLTKKSGGHSISHLNGYECINKPRSKQVPERPDIIFTKDSKFENEHSPGFYHSKFPTCGGLGNGWKYEFSFNFSLNADHEQDQILTIHDQGRNIKITNHLDPHTQKTTRKEKHRTRGILHRFCFDTLYSNEDQISKSIALTCPYPKDLTKLKLNKCCPQGEVYSEEGCVAATDDNTSIESLLLINGFSVQDSLKENSITYNKSKAYWKYYSKPEMIKSEAGKNCEDTGKTLYFDNLFDIGPVTRPAEPDGGLHYTHTMTDFHEESIKSIGDNFCVEVHKMDEANDGDEDDYQDSHDDYEDDDEEKVCQSDEEKTNLKVFYCGQKIIRIPKCCAKDFSINQRAASKNSIPKCTGTPGKWHKTRFIDLTNFTINKTEHVINVDDAEYYNFPPDTPLNIFGGEFEINEKTELVVETKGNKEKKIGTKKYCIDYVIDFCDKNKLLQTKVLQVLTSEDISNWKGNDGVATSILSANSHDSQGSKTLKQVGFFISILFLIITMVIVMKERDSRRTGAELNFRISMCIVACLLLVYCDFFAIAVWQSEDSVQSVFLCTFRALFRYYVLLCAFTWMAIKSYYLMGKIRGNFLPSAELNRRFMSYAAFGFGLPLIMATLALGVDSAASKVAAQKLYEGTSGDSLAYELRPGFAEDNCWFSICSRGITVFLYIPVSLALILNFIFFSISAWKISRAKSSLAKTQETLSKQPNGNDKPSVEEGKGLMNGVNYEENSRSFARSLSRLASKGGRAMKRGVSREFDRETMRTNLKLFIAMGLTWIADVGVGIYENNASGCKSSEKECTNYGLIMVLIFPNIFLGPLIFLAIVRPQQIKDFCHTISLGRFFKPSTATTPTDTSQVLINSKTASNSENNASIIKMTRASRAPTQN